MRALLAIAAAVALVATGLTTASAPAEALTTARYAGADRYATSVEISRAATTGTTVFLASGEKFPDALAAGPVAAAERAPLLLTTRDRLPQTVADRIAELKPTEIVIVGSTASVSSAVATQAHELNGARIIRVGGANRVETSLRLFDRMQEKGGTVTKVWVASGFSFPDALVAASVAGRERAAVILDHHGADAASAQAWIDRVRVYFGGRAVRIAGGTASVSAADAQAIGRAAASVARYAGGDRYATARIINDTFAATAREPAMLLATGTDFPDALPGSVHAALRGIPMYLATPACNATISQMLQAEAAQRGITRVIGLGSASSISDASLSLSACAAPAPAPAPAPSPAPAPAPGTGALAQQVGAAFGTFAARSYSGSGDRVIDLGAGIPYAQLRVTMSASGVNHVRALDSARATVDVPLSITGAHSGTALLATESRDRPARFLEVFSSGSWSIDVRDLTSAPVLTGSVSSASDGVYLYGGTARAASAAHQSGSYFGIRQLQGSGQQSWRLSTWTSTSSSSTSLQAGPSVLSVLAGKPWSLTLR